MGLCAAAMVGILLAGLARLWSWATGESMRDAPVWGETGVLASAFVAVVIVAAVTLTVLHGLMGAPRRVLADIGAVPVDRGRVTPGSRSAVGVNVVDALAIGLGVTPPDVALIDDEAPNALSVRWGRHRTIALTSGLLELPRSELEAVCAHELAHLHAGDARWISAGEATLGRAHTAGLLLAAAGALIVAGSLKAGLLPSWIAAGVALAAVGALTALGVDRARTRLRVESDTVADVAAIRLARDPGSLGAALETLATDVRVVRRNSWRSDHSWFVPIPDAGAGSVRAAAGDDAVVGELRRRAAAAYEIAGVPFSWR